MKRLSDLFSHNIFKKVAEDAENGYVGETKRSFMNDHFYLYRMSLWYGNLLPKAQISKARELGLSNAVFTKYNATLGYLTILALEHAPFFLATQFSKNNTDDMFFWANLGAGIIINSTRAAFAFAKEKPSPGLGLVSFGVNSIYYSKKAVEKLIQKRKEN
jgi:hypothetical protein